MAFGGLPIEWRFNASRSVPFRPALLITLILGLVWPFAACSAAEPPAASPADGHFDVNEYRVTGNSVLESRAVERAVYPHLGPNKTLKDVELARTALEQVYHDAGYGTVFVDIPEQTVDEGIVRLHVTEGRLHSVTVTGARYFSGRQIKSAMPAAKVGAVPDLPAVQTQLGAINAATADRSVVPVLKAGPIPGTVDLNLKVQDSLPVHAAVEVNNQYSADTSPLRASLLLSYNNLFGRLDKFSLQLQGVPGRPGQSDVLAASYVTSVFGTDSLSLVFINSSSDVATIGTLGVTGKGKVYTGRYIAPLHNTQDFSDSLSLGLDYKDFAQDVALDKSSALHTPISYVNLSAAYTGARRFETRQYAWSGSATLGLRGVVNKTIDFADKCYGCKPDYVIWRADASVDQRLPRDFGVTLRLAGQYTIDPVVSNEQFLIGGAQSVRGYLEAEELGDTGVRGTLEFRAPNLARKESFMHTLIPFAFVDAGRIGFQLPLPGQPRSAKLASWGAGLNIETFSFLSGTFTWTRTLETGSHTGQGASRWLFNVRSSW